MAWLIVHAPVECGLRGARIGSGGERALGPARGRSSEANGALTGPVEREVEMRLDRRCH